jgi:hypothetical protein
VTTPSTLPALPTTSARAIPSVSGGSLARRLSLTGGAVIAVVMVSLGAVMAWTTAQQTRGHLVQIAGEKAAAVAL